MYSSLVLQIQISGVFGIVMSHTHFVFSCRKGYTYCNPLALSVEVKFRFVARSHCNLHYELHLTILV